MRKKKNLAETFLEILVAHGHSGDRMCLSTIAEKLDQGLNIAVKHYEKIIPNAEVKKLSARQINTLVCNGAIIWSEEGIIFKSKKLKVPELNGRLLLIEHLEEAAAKPVIVIKN